MSPVFTRKSDGVASIARTSASCTVSPLRVSPYTRNFTGPPASGRGAVTKRPLPATAPPTRTAYS